MPKRRANWFAERVGELIRKGFTFREAVKAAKEGKHLKRTHSSSITEIRMPRHRRHFFGRRRGVSHRPKSIPLLPIVGVAEGLYLPYKLARDTNKHGMQLLDEYVKQLSIATFAYDPDAHKFWTGGLANFWAPVALGAIGHIIANKLGLNKILARHKIPVTL